MERPRWISVPAAADRENEDAVRFGDRVAVLVDGAGLPAELRAGCVHGVRWFARAVARVLARRLADRTGSMAEALSATIAEVAASHGPACDLSAGSPSATLAAWRTTGDRLEHLVLADASLVLTDRGGGTRVVTDDRLQLALRRAGVPVSLDGALAHLEGAAVGAAGAAVRERSRNRRGGFWCVQADPEAAFHSVTGEDRLDDLAAVVAVSDGASRAWDLLDAMAAARAAEIAAAGPLSRIAKVVRAAEDRHEVGLRRLGMKVHDDLTIVAARHGAARRGLRR